MLKIKAPFFISVSKSGRIMLVKSFRLTYYKLTQIIRVVKY